MDINDAKQKCEKKANGFKAVSCIPFKNLLVFNMQLKGKEDLALFDPYLLAVDTKTGKISEFSIYSDPDAFMEAATTKMIKL